MHGGESEEMLVLQGFRGSNKYKICLTLIKKSSDFTTTTALAQGFCITGGRSIEILAIAD